MTADKKMQAWVDAQNELNSQERQNFKGKYIEDVDQTFPVQYTREQIPE